jgi:hypothetical protein
LLLPPLLPEDDLEEPDDREDPEDLEPPPLELLTFPELPELLPELLTLFPLEPLELLPELLYDPLLELRVLRPEE